MLVPGDKWAQGDQTCASIQLSIVAGPARMARAVTLPSKSPCRFFHLWLRRCAKSLFHMQIKNSERSAVIVGCARDCEPFLPTVLQNVTTIANLYSQAAFVFVENDSTDKTGEILQKWLSKRGGSRLVCLDGLAAREKRRTARLAIARNSYIEVVLQSPNFARFDHLVVIDFDDANTNGFSAASLTAAIRFLDSISQNAAVFANQLPYYDIWALRHDIWCPNDCWSEVENRPAWLPRHRAVERYVKSSTVKYSSQGPAYSCSISFRRIGDL